MFFLLLLIGFAATNGTDTSNPINTTNLPTQSCSDICLDPSTTCLNGATDTYTRCNCYRDLNSCGVSYDCMTLEITTRIKAACDNIHCHFCSSASDLISDRILLLFAASLLFFAVLI